VSGDTNRETTVNDSLGARVRELTADAALVRAAAAVRADGGARLALGDAALRGLYRPEIDQLEAQGNTARDWSRVRVADGFNARRVRNCEFHGDVVLGRFTRYVPLADGLEVVAGLSNSTVADCVIGHNALVRDVRLLANYVVCEEAVLADCGRVTCSPGAAFGNGARVPLALEGGGREVELFAELDVELAAAVARPGPRRGEVAGYRRAVSEYRDRVTADRGVIGAGARVWSVPRLEDTFVGPAARVDGATAVLRSTILSAPDEPTEVGTGAVVADSLLQWGTCVTGLAVVERSLLVETARVERHGKVKDSVIGPNTEVAAGEVTSSVLGPFVGCHHQSLLISTLWPAGRGNVGYGANVGSNHTSRAPDQEFRAGEGLFLGLGVNVKFPCDLSRAAYSVVACGTNLPPQKVTFPFSLVAPPQEHVPGVPPAFNQISPGWMLRENVYALRRCEAKFRSRNRATRGSFDFAVFRPETVELMRAAGRALRDVPGVRDVYTERDVPGLGKNVLTERDRLRGLAAYQFHTCYYALLGLLARSRVAGAGEAERLLDVPSADGLWEYRRRILTDDFGLADVGVGLRALKNMARQVARDVERARERDTLRGVKVIDDYLAAHPAVDDDAVVLAARADADRLRDEARAVLATLPPTEPRGLLLPWSTDGTAAAHGAQPV
jgi:hypothetical protein